MTKCLHIIFAVSILLFDVDVKIGLLGATAFFDYGTNRVGLGNTSPNQKLNVTGNISASGYYYGDAIFELERFCNNIV